MSAPANQTELDEIRWTRAAQLATAVPADTAPSRPMQVSVVAGFAGLLYGSVVTTINVFFPDLVRGPTAEIIRGILTGVLALALLILTVLRSRGAWSFTSVLLPLTSAEKRLIRRQAYGRSLADPVRLTVTSGYARQARQRLIDQLPAAGFWCCLAAWQTSYTTLLPAFWFVYVIFIACCVIVGATSRHLLGRFLHEHPETSAA